MGKGHHNDSVSTFSMIFYERSEAATRHTALGADARRETPTSRSARRSSAVRVVACIYLQLVRPFLWQHDDKPVDLGISSGIPNGYPPDQISTGPQW